MSAALAAARRGLAAVVVAAPVAAFFARGVWSPPGPVPAGRGVWEVALGSLLLGSCAALGATVLAWPAAMVLRRRGPGSALAVAACLLPLAVPSYVLAIGWYPLLGTHGVLSRLVGVPTLYTPVGVGILLALQLWPVPALLGAAALARADPRLDEAARLHAGRGMTLRLALPGLGAGFAIALVLSTGDFGVSGCFQLATVSEEVYARYSTLRDHRAAALAALPLLVVLPAALSLASRRAGRLVAGDWRPWGRATSAHQAAFAALLAVAVGVPAFYLVRTGLAKLPQAATLHRPEVVGTLRYAGIGTLVAGALALLGTGRRLRGLVELAFLLPFALPGVVTGLGVIAIDKAMGWSLRESVGGQAVLVVAMAARVAWLPWKAIDLTLAEGRDAMHEAARVHGVGALARWLSIDVPRGLPAFLGGLAAAFLLALGEVGVAVLLLPPAEYTLARRIFEQIHGGYEWDVAAMCLMLWVCVLGTGLGTGLVGVALRWKWGGDGRRRAEMGNKTQ